MLKKYTLPEKRDYVFIGKLHVTNKRLVSFLKNKMFFVFFNKISIQKQVLQLPDSLAVQLLSKKSFIVYYVNFITKKVKFFFFKFLSFLREQAFFIEKNFLFKVFLRGIGFKFENFGLFLKISIGFSHSVFIYVPRVVSFKFLDVQSILMSGFSRQFLGQVSSRISFLKKPDLYKNKGFFFINLSKEKQSKTILFKKEFQKKNK
jgi:large subunit ribosomal protein L6